MDAIEVKKLWALLGELYPRQKQNDSENRLLAWSMALEPFEYTAIREAALAHARQCDYYPSISELTAHLPNPDKNAWMDEIIEENDRRFGAGRLWQLFIDKQGLADGDEFSVSRYAREHGLTWEQAAEDAARLGLYQPQSEEYEHREESFQ